MQNLPTVLRAADYECQPHAKGTQVSAGMNSLLDRHTCVFDDKDESGMLYASAVLRLGLVAPDLMARTTVEERKVF